MTIRLDLSPEVEARLREQARASGKELESYVREAVEEKLASATTPKAADLTPQQRVELLRQWFESHPKRPGVHLDDSRESIYAGRGE